MILYLDTETYSPIPIGAGTARYATQVEVMIVTWAVDNGPVRTWDRTSGRPMPPDLLNAAKACDQVIAHNVTFDRTVIEHDLPDVGEALAGKWYCTMAQALRHGLPGGLDKLSTILRLPSGKLNGHALILLFCKPGKKGLRNTARSHPEEWDQFLKYAAQDIVAMRDLHRKLPKWNDQPRELVLWALDQTINRRGVAVDVEFAQAAVRATKEEADGLCAATRKATDGLLDRATQRDRMLAYLFMEYGVELPDLKADTVDRRLNDPELPEYVKNLLRYRQQASKSSTSKYKRLLESHVVGRLYHTLQYCGAQRTGRWARRLFQPQNLPRPTLKFPEIEAAIQAVLDGTETVLVDDIMEAMSSAIRSALVAKPGHKLAVADLSNIEGRAAAWLADERWKLEAFSLFDLGLGPDLYVAAYARSFDMDPADVSKEGRQIGKVQELALQYEGGVGAFVSMAASLGIDLEQLAERALPTLSAEARKDAEGVYQWAKRRNGTMGLDEPVYVACEALKRLWREAHPAIHGMWGACHRAAVSAVQNPGVEFKAGRLTFDRKGAWLRMRLPSGRFLLYPNPKVEWSGERASLSYAAWNVYTKSWKHEPTYGGKLFENACQAVARDVMAEGMFRAEDTGYPIVLTVHDELVCEVPDSQGYTGDGLADLLAEGADWTHGLPLAAKGYETHRYRKED